MKIGIGLPATTPGVQGKLILDWARQADAGPFSSLGLIDRIVYDNYEPLITLAAVGGATERIRLATTVLLAPLRNGALLAKQSASLDALSGGRLTLGLAVGGREDDYQIAEKSLKNRGKRFVEQLALMERIWSGQLLEGEKSSQEVPRCCSVATRPPQYRESVAGAMVLLQAAEVLEWHARLLMQSKRSGMRQIELEILGWSVARISRSVPRLRIGPARIFSTIIASWDQ